MNEIKIINVELKSKRYSECQICHNDETKYNLNCELKDMYFKLGVCHNCYTQINI